jgi:hypothetical protein
MNIDSSSKYHSNHRSVLSNANDLDSQLTDGETSESRSPRINANDDDVAKDHNVAKMTLRMATISRLFTGVIFSHCANCTIFPLTK